MRPRVLGLIALIALAAGAVYFFGFAATQIEAVVNGVATPPPYAASARALAVHGRLTVADLHADTLLWDGNLLQPRPTGHVDVPRLAVGNVAVQAFTIVTNAPRDIQLENNDAATDSIGLLGLAQRWPVATWTSRFARAQYQARRLHDAAGRSRGRLTVLQRAGDLVRFLERRRLDDTLVAGFLGVEGAHALDGDLGNLDRLYDEGVRMVAPVHLADNEMAGSAHGVGRGGLTDLGRQLVQRLNAKGVLVDLAHASPQAFDDTLALTSGPVVVSHTGVRGTCPNVRNLTDDQLRAVARTGGVVGIGFWETATCGGDAAAIARAIRHAVSVAGIDHVALGSDFDGAVRQPFDATGMVQITDALLDAGFAEDGILAVMGGNVVRLLGTALPP